MGQEGRRGAIVGGAARVRALSALAAMGCGFVLALRVPSIVEGGISSGSWFGLGIVAGAVGLGTRGRVCAAALLVSVLALSGGWFTLRILERPADRLVLPIEPAEAVVRVEGVVVQAPAVRVGRGAMVGYAIGGTSQRMVIDLRRVEREATPTDQGGWRRASGRLVVYVDGPVEAPVGRRVRVSGRASAAGAPTNPGQSDQRLWAAQDAEVGTMSVPEASLIESAAGEPGLLEPLVSAGRRVREWLAARARAGLANIGDERARALTGSLLLGTEEVEGRAIATQFQRLGLAHVLAISGVHVAMLAWATLLVVRVCGDFGGLEPVLAGCVVGLYLLVVPAEAPIVRSGVMVLALLLGEAMGRRYDGVVILAWTAAALLILRPMDLWSLGFQLSFGVTGVLLGAGKGFHERVWGVRSPLAERVHDPAWWMRGLESLKRATSASVLAWAVASPWIAARVGLFSPMAPVSSLLVGVPVSLLMLVGFVALVVSTLVPGGGLVWVVAGPLARGALGCVDWLDALPGASIATGSVPLAWGAAGSVGVLWVMTKGGMRLQRGRMAGVDGPGQTDGGLGAWVEWRAAGTWLIVLGLGAWLMLAMTLGRSLGRDVALRIDTLDVGDATCHLIRSGDEAMLWDCGASWAGAGEVRIPGAIRALGAGPVRTGLVTHANFDHFNALPDVAWRVGVRRVLVSALLVEAGEGEPRGATAAMLRLLRAQGVEVVVVGTGEVFRLGEAEVRVVWPIVEAARHGSVNDQSLAAVFEVRTEGGVRRVLMTGDMEERGIAGVLEGLGTGADRRVDVLEVPHHGAWSRSAAGLVESVGPVVIVQSTGRTRVGMGRVDDPRWRESSGSAEWLTTAADGATWVEIGRDGLVRRGWTVPGR